jgi:glyoxylase-like metal-dependent hydrolase (beta-lactamase superfamily II)
MSAQLDVLTAGYVGGRVASTVVLLRDEDLIAVVDPGMVADRAKILEPLSAVGVRPEQVTDVIFSHHHPDHTVNAALFQRARIHDFWATYVDDLWIDRKFEGGVEQLSPSVRLMLTPGHTQQDISTLAETEEGLVVCTHVWWKADGPAEDPFAEDARLLSESRQNLLDLQPVQVVPGHGPAFVPDATTPR